MIFDFSQPAPRAKSLKESQQIIDALWVYATQSQENQKTLTSKTTNLEEKLNTSSSNSSLPPSTDLFKQKKPKKNITAPEKANENKVRSLGIKGKVASLYRSKKLMIRWFAYLNRLVNAVGKSKQTLKKLKWHRYKNGKIKHKMFKSAMAPIRKNIERQLKKGTTCGHTKTENSCKLILKHKESLWTFVEHEGIEPTNNLAEQQIRSYVLWRKNSFGTQSERGNMFVERMMTTTATCKLQNRNRYDYITAAVAAHLKNEPAPSLLPAEELTKPMKKAA